MSEDICTCSLRTCEEAPRQAAFKFQGRVQRTKGCWSPSRASPSPSVATTTSGGFTIWYVAPKAHTYQMNPQRYDSSAFQITSPRFICFTGGRHASCSQNNRRAASNGCHTPQHDKPHADRTDLTSRDEPACAKARHKTGKRGQSSSSHRLGRFPPG